jgi:DNA-binding NarL/FixJ family response regulator
MSKIRIVLADDHSVMREGTRLIFTREKNFEIVGEAADGQEALKQVETLLPDLLIFDISMPHLNGVELARLVSERFPKVKLLVLTAHEDTIYLRTLLKFGVKGFVPKSASGRQLVEAALTVMAGRQALPDNSFETTLHYEDNQMESNLQRLSSREIEVLGCILAGDRNTAIAEKLFISSKTLETHIRNIYSKLGVESRAEILVDNEKWRILLSQFKSRQ